MYSQRTLLIGMIAILATAAVAACDGHERATEVEGPHRPAAVAQGFGSLRVMLTDAPTDELSRFSATFSLIEWRPCGGRWEAQGLNPAVQYDLLQLRDGRLAEIFSEALVEPGEYCEVRLSIDSVEAIDMNGRRVEVEVASNRLLLKDRFRVHRSIETTVTLDFVLDESLKLVRAGRKLVLTPVVRGLAPKYRPVDGGLLHPELQSVSTFAVQPDAPTIIDLGGGASIEFPAGSVAERMEFSASIWTHGAEALSRAYRFEPPYLFSVAPTLRIPVSRGAGKIFVDGQALPTELEEIGGELRAVTQVPHFSTFKFCETYVDRNPFADLDEFEEAQIDRLDWASIHELQCAGVIRGFDIGNGQYEFRPLQPITRAAFTKVLVYMLLGDSVEEHLNMSAQAPFPDLEGHWGEEVITAGHMLGLVYGDGDTGNFRPNDPLTRNEAAAIIVRAAAIASSDDDSEIVRDARKRIPRHTRLLDGYYRARLEDGQDEPAWEYVDVPRESWYTNPIYALLEYGAVWRYLDDRSRFRPLDNITRDEVVSLVFHVFSNFHVVKRRLHCADPSLGNDACSALLRQIPMSQRYLDYWNGNPTPRGFHAGLDFTGVRDIYSPVSGVVQRVAGLDEQPCRYARVVSIREVGRPHTLHVFLHMGEVAVSQGDAVVAGDRLGVSNNVGLYPENNCGLDHDAGSHIHYEIRHPTSSDVSIGQRTEYEGGPGEPTACRDIAGCWEAWITKNPATFEL